MPKRSGTSSRVDETNSSDAVLALTDSQEEYVEDDPRSSWDALHDALWRTPFTDYAEEWVSTAMFNAKQFLFRAFEKAVLSSHKKAFRLVPVDNTNWPGYDRRAKHFRCKVDLLKR